MGKVVTKVMKGHTGNEFPFLVASLTFELRPEMLNASFGKVVGTLLLPQPGSALTGKDILTLWIAIVIMWSCWGEVVKEDSAGRIVQIECPGFSPLESSTVMLPAR